MKLDIPFYSQYSEEIENIWQTKVCAIVCVKMVLDYFGIKTETRDLVKEGLLISKELEKRDRVHDGYTEQYGWGHELLVILLRNNNIPSYRQEFKNLDHSENLLGFGINKIISNIKAGLPVLVSLAKDINNPRTSGHMVVVSGIEECGDVIKGLYINDPEAKSDADGKNKFVNISDFKKSWKKLAIFVEKV
ncbi:MAG: C39 family peptidase [Candidatus Paceibacterota bacterium]|jgi:hypothetical protein